MRVAGTLPFHRECSVRNFTRDQPVNCPSVMGFLMGKMPSGTTNPIFSMGCGGDGGIRTLGTDVSVRRFSKPLVSATHPRLRIAAARARYSEGCCGRQASCGPVFAGSGDSVHRKPDSDHRRFIAPGAGFDSVGVQVRAVWIGGHRVACIGMGTGRWVFWISGVARCWPARLPWP